MRFATKATMAMRNWHVQLIDLIRNRAAQTTALHIFTWEKIQILQLRSTQRTCARTIATVLSYFYLAFIPFAVLDASAKRRAISGSRAGYIVNVYERVRRHRTNNRLGFDW